MIGERDQGSRDYGPRDHVITSATSKQGILCAAPHTISKCQSRIFSNPNEAVGVPAAKKSACFQFVFIASTKLEMIQLTRDQIKLTYSILSKHVFRTPCINLQELSRLVSQKIGRENCVQIFIKSENKQEVTRWHEIKTQEREPSRRGFYVPWVKRKMSEVLGNTAKKYASRFLQLKVGHGAVGVYLAKIGVVESPNVGVVATRNSLSNTSTPNADGGGGKDENS